MTKEIHDINTRALDFVVELIDYITEYPDDDYMTMECLCRKLHKHELIAKVDGHWQPLDKRCEECIFVEGSHWCDGCDKTPKGMKEYDEYWAKADSKDEPQTETKMKTQNSNLTFEKRTMRDCYNCKRYETEGECVECHYEPKDEPQTDCSWK